ncbi:MAG: lipase family protein [Pirellulales bacterium]|nr:lipase family protein [Pirellulales bacterium]
MDLVERLRASWDSNGPPEWSVTELMASISDIAYQTPPAAERSYCGLGFEWIRPIIEDSMAVYVVSAKNVAVIAFRGTDDPADWLVNLKALSMRTPHGRVHRGFASTYTKLEKEVMAALQKQQPKHLWVTGHSLGGALAVVCAHRLIEIEKLPLHGVITFGQPMVAKKGLADYLDKQLLGRYARIVNGADIVPQVPPAYAHCGSLLHLTDDGIRRSEAKRPVGGAHPDEPINAREEASRPLTDHEFQALKASLKQRKESEKRPDGPPVYQGNMPWLRDHSIELYLAKIRSMIGPTGQSL